MFFWVFAIVFILAMLGLIFLNGLAISRSSGPPTPTNWWLLIGTAIFLAVFFAGLFQSIAFLFGG